jgi:hypothetical protein
MAFTDTWCCLQRYCPIEALICEPLAAVVFPYELMSGGSMKAHLASF